MWKTKFPSTNDAEKDLQGNSGMTWKKETENILITLRIFPGSTENNDLEIVALIAALQKIIDISKTIKSVTFKQASYIINESILLSLQHTWSQLISYIVTQ